MIPGGAYADAASLRRYLVALGDLPASTPSSPATDTLYRSDLRRDATRLPIEVHVLYSTAVGADDGRGHSHTDAYEHDAR